MAAAKYQVQNLTAILDYNRFQQTGPVREVMPALIPFTDKWSAFGWHVAEINGHDLKQVLDTLKVVQEVPGRPQMIVAHTLKGKGLSPFEKDQTNRKHGVSLTPEEAEVALSELDAQYDRLAGGSEHGHR